MTAGKSKVQHDVPPDALVRLKPHKLGRHYHKVPQYISETVNKYPRLISDYFLRNFRINLESGRMAVHEQVDLEPDCLFRNRVGKFGFAIDRELLGEALECYYGGVRVRAKEGLPNISTSEQRLRDRLGRDLVDIVVHALMAGGAAGEIEPHLDAYDQPQWEQVIEYVLTSHLSGQTASLHIFLDSRACDTLTTRLAGKTAVSTGVVADDSIKRLPLRLECVLASAQLPLAGVMALQPGDVLPIRLRERCEVRINRHPLFSGAIYEHAGALCLTSLESVSNP
ncbi:FliM/FliN family flagellar motor switch protein [Parazoarcus communis]|uniref:Flagellar motor switch protein FliN-like C-terminal domain-containing protein n=1 Tax=Parazoarcus communis SWub3 = DSM 12120 TaxID=1121029 RepID=A0A323V0F9_9RHOO|nr:FliM/FliN family flagellar motor switch protein [Parazoarcus communis]NMG69058.1 hypothetical protein [Parazoarcus communis SWub3 = DSM 12120]PZA16916.1 hypothetical protein DNK49_09735 [Azoarcus communis] [Parazoarcus communis SWub3 = DSM 12120]